MGTAGARKIEGGLCSRDARTGSLSHFFGGMGPQPHAAGQRMARVTLSLVPRTRTVATCIGRPYRPCPTWWRGHAA